jgi:excisionase family DNA binding protein
MLTLSLQQAANQAGVSKSTIFRAIRSGRLSAPRDDDGNFAIQVAELHRVYPPKSSGTSHEPAQPVPLDRDATPDAAAPERNATALALLEQQVKDLRERLEEMRGERDEWRATARAAIERPLMLPAPNPPARGWWRRLAG